MTIGRTSLVKSSFCFYFLFLFISCSLFSETGKKQDVLPIEFDCEAAIAMHGREVKEIENINISISAECEPLTTVAGCVNVLSGHFFQVEKDLVSNTIDPISLKRYYDSSNEMETFLGMGFGSQFPLFASEKQTGSRHSYAMISERDGFLLPYRSRSNLAIHGIDPRLLKKGYTNLSRAEVSGHANFVNWLAKPDANGWFVQLGDGTKRKYEKTVTLETKPFHQIGFPTKKIHLLTKEVKPNGNVLHFSYQMREGKPCLSKVETFNRTETAVLNSLSMSYGADACTAKSSCGSSCVYLQKTKSCFHGAVDKKILHAMCSTQNGEIVYRQLGQSFPRVAQVEKPDGRVLVVNYNDKGQVEQLQEPLGTHGELIPTYSFQYKKHQTTIQDALGEVSVYAFDSHQRLSKVTYLDDLKMVRQDHFIWSKEEGEEGWLKSKAIGIGDELSYFKSYVYDTKGNITRETLYGNLTGKKDQTFAFHQHKEMDHYSIDYEYSKGIHNLVTSKKTPEGLTVFYDYVPHTNLCTKMLLSYEGKIQERTFYTYDENAEVTLVIEDDGSGGEQEDLTDVTFRKAIITYPFLDVNHPAFGKPKEVIQAYFDNGQWIPLNRTEYSYVQRDDKEEILQKVYDSQGRFCYETAKVFDKKQHLILEKNALGQKTRYSYDRNHNKIKEVLSGSGKEIFYTYDAGNRLISREEKHENGEIFVTKYCYNALNQLICEIDPYGHKTSYAYDALGRQIECVYPRMEHDDGTSSHPTITKKYNLLNQVISEKDERGFTTKYAYNVYGSPTHITYPDGTIERFCYYPGGKLRKKQQADGTTLKYTYDAKGRIVKKQTFDSNRNLLKEEEYGYKGPLLVYKKDAMGLVTAYQYDKVGRKSAEIVGNDKVTHYVYDDFGRLIQIAHQCTQIETYHYDWLDRLIVKSFQDSHGNLYAKETYAYDVQGNRIKKSIAQTEDLSAHYSSCYQSDQTLLWKENPLGQRTTWFYNHHHANGIGQRIQARSMTDPLGRVTLEADDVFHRLVRRDVYEGDKMVSSLLFDYDAAGNLIKENASVMSEGSLIRHYARSRTYNSRGWLESEIELPHGKKVSYAYDAMGRLIQKVKPDGTCLYYTYDTLGRLQHLTSSDHTIAYRYAYDLNDNIIEVQDLIHHITQTRIYDRWNRLIEETLSPFMTIRYLYDTLDRVVHMLLPDGSFVNYTYDAFHLRKMERFNAEGHLCYSLDCHYDLRGHLLKIQSPAGSVDYAYNLLSRAVSVQSPHLAMYLEQFDPVGNLLRKRQIDPIGNQEEHFSYDRFDYLTHESTIDHSHYTYDSLGNCLRKNDHSYGINALNQVISDDQSQYAYDANGNLVSQSQPPTNYTYDALDRLISCCKETGETHFIYDAFGRCLQIKDPTGIKHLLYQGQQEIGSLSEGWIQEFRLLHPKEQVDKTFAIELRGEAFFPVQDDRGNICALQKTDGTLAQWYYYSAFGKKALYGNSALLNPWCFANKREASGLLLFPHRLYNSHLMRWQTPDPLGFEDGLNLYCYVHNNPFSYRDPDGQFAVAIPILQFGFGLALGPLIVPTMGVIATAAVGYSLYQLATYVDSTYNQIEVDNQNNIEIKEEKTGKRRGKDNETIGGPPRDQKTKDYLPDPIAEGSPHTTLGIQGGRRVSSYTQGATFGEKGEFKGRTDVTDHGRKDHPNPHFHPATGPNAAKSPPIAIPKIN